MGPILTIRLQEIIYAEINILLIPDKVMRHVAEKIRLIVLLHIRLEYQG